MSIGFSHRTRPRQALSLLRETSPRWTKLSLACVLDCLRGPLRQSLSVLLSTRHPRALTS
uniref:Uncharacterized protein n=1 Tax=uncultured marine virus TaxID=186617 RepID=A0A0F7L7E3_9VIRU|nr:hypothetical protein [uncultured marine virus]